MQGDHFRAEEVLPVGDARGDVDVVEAAVGYHRGGCPGAGGEAGFLDLEPATADAFVCQGVVDLFEVGEGRALVACVHDVAGAGLQGVPPDGLDGAAGGDGDDFGGGGGGVGPAVAGKVVGGDVGYGAVVDGGADGVGDGVGLSAGVELDEDGVG